MQIHPTHAKLFTVSVTSCSRLAKAVKNNHRWWCWNRGKLLKGKQSHKKSWAYTDKVHPSRKIMELQLQGDNPMNEEMFLSVADDRGGGRSVWMFSLDLTGSPLQLLHHFLLRSTSSSHLLHSLCNWEWLPDNYINISLSPLPCISVFSQLTLWWEGDGIQSYLLPFSLLGHFTKAGLTM